MTIKQNTAINPTQNTPLIQLTRTRSPRIRDVEVENRTSIAAGYSNPSTGMVHIPDTKNAFGRTVRYHEALHVQHTPAHNAKMRDALDQALEDARLHRYKSLAHTTQFPQARRDEIAIALRDLRRVARKTEVSALSSIVTMRAMAILLAGLDGMKHASLLSRVLRKFGPHASDDFTAAIKMLESSDGKRDKVWECARKHVERYFAKDYTPESLPSPSAPSEDAKEESESSAASESDSSDEKPSEEAKDTKPGKDMDIGEDESDAGASEESEEGEEKEESDSDSEDEGEEEESKPAPKEEEKPIEVIPAEPKPKTCKRAPKEDEYTESLVAPFDADNLLIKEYARDFPITVYVRRLDMGTNRVKLSLGKRHEAPTKRGRKIRGSRLAAASFQPGVRAFKRPIQTGQGGTILIDASGSMRLTQDVLHTFLKDAPALTLAFYNAPEDSRHYGNIYIYAANGFRAASLNMYDLKCGKLNDRNVIPNARYGIGNVIDYQAMVWLSKQPGPRYLLTDCQWTQWQIACQNAVARFEANKTFTVVRPDARQNPIQIMIQMLEKKRRAQT